MSVSRDRVITTEEVRELVTYREETGTLRWNKRTAKQFSDSWRDKDKEAQKFNARYAGTRAFGSKYKNGRRYGSFKQVQYRADEIVWIYFGNELPEKGFHLVHIDKDVTNDRIENLKIVDAEEFRESYK